MRKILIALLILTFMADQSWATTWYACTSGGNWSNSVWTSVMADQGTCVAALGTPVAGDTAILNSSSGNITLSANAACATLTETGYTGTLALSTRTLTTTANQTWGGTITASGVGNVTFSGSQTLTPNGVSFPGTIMFSNANQTLTLGGDLTTTGIFNYSTPSNFTITIAGAYNMMVGTLTSTAGTLAIVSTQTLTVSTAMNLVNAADLVSLKAVTASSSAILVYNGTDANLNSTEANYTDIDASRSPTSIYNWNGGTLLRTKQIVNVNASMINAGLMII